MANFVLELLSEEIPSRMQKNADKVKTTGKDFLEKFVKSEGAKKTESGLAYKIIKPGLIFL